MENILVQKYGGTSMGSIEKIRHIAEMIISFKKQNEHMVVVVSAMAGETDRLIALTKSITEMPALKEYDSIFATGEQVSAALLAMTLQSMRYNAESYLGFQVGIRTDAAHSKAKILSIDTQKIYTELDKGKIVIIGGCQGISPEGNITTLGRGGSDLTAVAVAAALGAKACEIYTDVSGIFTADPRICSDARKIEKISYEEMLEMASTGAKVLERRSVACAMNHSVRLYVRSSFEQGQGTLVCEEDPTMENILVSGITHDKKESRISVRGDLGVKGGVANLFSHIADKNIVVDMIVQNIPDEEAKSSISFTVPKEDRIQAVQIVKDLYKDAHVTWNDSISKISIIGAGMRTHAGVAATMFDILAKENIDIKMISTSEIKVSCVIEEKYTELAVRLLHEGFQLAKKKS
ncbi:MAG: aspartate kinase [Deltaproteobacteria bacterium]|nr:aspartate kinase [Deltaproteobacteria bacterium]